MARPSKRPIRKHGRDLPLVKLTVPISLDLDGKLSAAAALLRSNPAFGRNTTKASLVESWIREKLRNWSPGVPPQHARPTVEPLAPVANDDGSQPRLELAVVGAE
jgi:hypothetical protein